MGLDFDWGDCLYECFGSKSKRLERNRFKSDKYESKQEADKRLRNIRDSYRHESRSSRSSGMQSWDMASRPIREDVVLESLCEKADMEPEFVNRNSVVTATERKKLMKRFSTHKSTSAILRTQENFQDHIQKQIHGDRVLQKNISSDWTSKTTVTNRGSRSSMVSRGGETRNLKSIIRDSKLRYRDSHLRDRESKSQRESKLPKIPSRGASLSSVQSQQPNEPALMEDFIGRCSLDPTRSVPHDSIRSMRLRKMETIASEGGSMDRRSLDQSDLKKYTAERLSEIQDRKSEIEEKIKRQNKIQDGQNDDQMEPSSKNPMRERRDRQNEIKDRHIETQREAKKSRST